MSRRASQMVLKTSPTASGRGGVLADQAEAFLVLGGDGVLEPEQAMGFEILAEAGGLDRGQAVVAVVEQVRLEAVGVAQGGEELRDVDEVLRRRPDLLVGEGVVGGVVGDGLGAGAVAVAEAGDGDLGADGAVALVEAGADGLDGLLDRAALGVGVAEHLRAAGAAEELVERHAGGLGLDVPERGVDAGDGGHRHRAAPPVGAAVEVLPDILDAGGVAADQAGDDMLLEIGDDGLLAAVEGGVADAGQALVGEDLHGDEVAPGGADDDADVGDLHWGIFMRLARGSGGGCGCGARAGRGSGSPRAGPWYSRARGGG